MTYESVSQRFWLGSFDQNDDTWNGVGSEENGVKLLQDNAIILSKMTSYNGDQTAEQLQLLCEKTNTSSIFKHKTIQFVDV